MRRLLIGWAFEAGLGGRTCGGFQEWEFWGWKTEGKTADEVKNGGQRSARDGRNRREVGRAAHSF